MVPRTVLATKTLDLRCWLLLCLVAGSLIAAPPAGAVAGYGDVAADSYYAEPVQWALDEGIVEIDGACFSPHSSVTRGEAVVHLWRMEGRPAAPRHRFSDITTRAQHDAVSWALEAGITRGTGANTFSPAARLTRAEIAAFLHRLADEPTAPPHRFSDVTADWQQAPVSWMAANAITTGTTPSTFSPNTALTRAQLVTFLYRYSGEPEVTVDPRAESCCALDSDAARGLDPCGLAAELERLVQTARDWDGRAETAVAVILSDGSRHGVAADQRVSSASAVKPLWAAAAIHTAGLEKVVPLWHRALVLSDNHAAGALIDLAGGVDAVNGWVGEVAGLELTHLSSWSFGRTRVSHLGRGPTRTTVGELAQFYTLLHQGRLLGAAETEQLKDWLRQTPRRRTYVDGALLERLPESTAAAALHKTGWLPPGWGPDLRVVIDAGLVLVPDGDWFAMALSSGNGAHYDRSIAWVELAACRIYTLVADDLDHDCRRSGDPVVR